MILITGKSALAYAISKRLPNCIIVRRPEYDFSIQEDCNRSIIDFPNPDVVINIFCNFNDNWWESSVINYVAPSSTALGLKKIQASWHSDRLQRCGLFCRKKN